MPEIQFLTVSVGLLRKNSFNSNKVSALNEEKIRESLRRNGMFKPILVRQIEGVDGYEIIGGEHRWEQAKELGFTEVPIANLGLIDDKRAKEIGVIDNARYGADDAILFADILKDIGSIDEVQQFLPYGDADLSAIFSVADIELGDLDSSEPDEEDEAPEEPIVRPPKTHTIMRFKVSLADAERLTALIATTRKDHGFTTSDDLTNAGDALVHLLSSHIAPATTLDGFDEDWKILQEIEEEQNS